MTGITAIVKWLDLGIIIKLLCFSIKLKIYIPHPGGDKLATTVVIELSHTYS